MNKRKVINNLLFLGIVFLAMLYFVFREQDMKEIIAHINTANMFYWVIAVICVILFIGCESIIIFYMMKSIQQEVKLTHCYLYSFVGFFFSCITPSATGGQPAQIYFMRKDKISVATSTLVLLIVTITYKMVLIAIGAFTLIIRPNQIMYYLSPVIGFCYLGLFLNIAVVGVMSFLVFDPTVAKNVLISSVKLLNKLKIIKKPDNIFHRIDSTTQKYNEVAVYFRTHKHVVWNVLLMTVFQRMLLFYVTYLVYRSFGLNQYGMFTIIVLQGMISVAVDMLPLPGGMGITEKLFLVIFTPIFGEITLPALVVSRGLSYYTQLLLSALLTIIAYFTIGRTIERNDTK